ncbi:MAG TPA: CAP domain-containing protein [Solirubrobacteraceae bacterium]|nr:CAP domain-containing protein [Solirubrobacteraceae bacterium]
MVDRLRVPATRSFLATVVSIICTAFLGAVAALPAAASPRSETSRVHAGCAQSAAHGTRRKRAHARLCRAASRKSRVRHTVKSSSPKVRPLKQHRTRSHAQTPAEAETETEAAAAAAVAQSAAQRDAATIAAVLATPCQNTELTPEAADIGLVRAAVLCLINRKRAEAGESPLVPNAQLEQAAEEHAQELVADDYFAHVSPSGETPVDRIRDTGYIPNPGVGYVIGENLAWGTYQLSTPQAIVSAWIASPGHLANILEAQYHDTGIGITSAVPPSLAPGAPGATYAQEFGVIVQ